MINKNTYKLLLAFMRRLDDAKRVLEELDSIEQYLANNNICVCDDDLNEDFVDQVDGQLQSASETLEYAREDIRQLLRKTQIERVKNGLPPY